MAVQAKALQRLCLLWRATSSGVSGHGNVLGGSTPCWLHRCLSSSSSHHPRTTSAHTASTLPAFLSGESSFSAGHHTHLKNSADTSVGDESCKHGKSTSNMLEICSDIASLSLSSRDVKLHERELNLASWPNPQHLEYVCPSEKLSSLPELAILDHLPNSIPYDLPQTPSVVSLIIDPVSSSVEISEPTTTNTNAPKEAREIMKIRRRKMKRHLLKKFRKRMAFTLRKIKRDRRKKKDAVFQARLAKIKDWGDSFSAKDWVQEQLDKARKGGYYINVLEKRQ